MTHVTVPTRHDGTARFALLTDTGLVRTRNEDAFGADEAAGLFVVCDGMGGAAGGEIASQLAAQVFLQKARQLGLETSPVWRLQHAVKAANAAVFAESQHAPHLRGMGTTLVALELDAAAGVVWTTHVGDSRCYRLRGGVLRQLTEDHSYVDEQVRMGAMTPVEAEHSQLRHVITRAVGSHADVEADIASHAGALGDVFLLCSDGLTGELDDAEIAGVLRAMGDDLQAGAHALIHMANEAGGGDNITVILVRLEG
jgi:serine/threonine protein phosphatase PrpC